MGKLEYHGEKPKYNKWANTLWSKGLTTTVGEVADLLHTSEKWVNLNILPDISYVIYSSKFVYEKKAGTTTKRINMDDVVDWIISFGKFECQTEIIDLYSYLSLADKKKADVCLKAYNDKFKELGDFYNKGTIPESVLSIIRENFTLHSDINKNIKITDRTKYKWVEVPSFNIFEREYYFANESGSAELFYRKAILNGDIKVTLGKGRVLFVKSNFGIDKMKMPFVVKKNAKIIVK